MTVQIKIDMNKVEYELGISYKEALSMVTRLVNEAYELIDTLQNRVLKLEIESNCDHMFHKHEYGFACVHCNKQKGF